MSSHEKYDRKSEYSYAIGAFPSFEVLMFSPEKCIKLFVSDRTSGEGIEKLINQCKINNIKIEVAPRLLQRISGKKNTFVAMLVKKSFTELAQDKNHIVLHNIMDAGNLGTIMRSALGFGFHDIAIIKPATDPYEPQTIRASMGSIFRLNCQEFDSFDDYNSLYKDRELYPFMLNASYSLKELAEIQAKSKKNYSLIFGNEGSGLPNEFKNLGKPCRIFHSSEIDSLNLSVAASIAMQRFTEENYKEEKIGKL